MKNKILKIVSIILGMAMTHAGWWGTAWLMSATEKRYETACFLSGATFTLTGILVVIFGIISLAED